MIYLVEEVRTGNFIFCKSVSKIVSEFPRLKKKYSTINLRFSKLKKENKPLIIREWGFNIFKAKDILSVKRLSIRNKSFLTKDE